MAHNFGGGGPRSSGDNAVRDIDRGMGVADKFDELSYLILRSSQVTFSHL